MLTLGLQSMEVRKKLTILKKHIGAMIVDCMTWF